MRCKRRNLCFKETDANIISGIQRVFDILRIAAALYDSKLLTAGKKRFFCVIKFPGDGAQTILRDFKIGAYNIVLAIEFTPARATADLSAFLRAALFQQLLIRQRLRLGQKPRGFCFPLILFWRELADLTFKICDRCFKFCGAGLAAYRGAAGFSLRIARRFFSSSSSFFFF